MLDKLTQFILNRAFDKQLVRDLKEKHIGINFSRKGHRVFFPQPVTLRPSPSSDFSVFLQVFKEEQYLPMVNICLLNKINVSSILDLGSNVGFTTIYLSRFFEKAKIYAIEPDINNFNTLVQNTSFLKNVKYINAAVWSKNTLLCPSYEEQSDWGKTFSENTDEKHIPQIEAITIQNMIDENHLTSIDILKIDIEGAEKQVFESNLDFLKITKVIAIEIHEQYVRKEQIHQVLASYGFILAEFGELSLGINKKLI